MPADFHWIRPEWLLAIPVVVVIAVLTLVEQLRQIVLLLV